MLIYKLQAPNQYPITIQIQLLENNPIVEIWKNVLLTVTKNIPGINWYATGIQNHQRHYNKDEALTHLSQLHACYKYLHRKNINDYSFEIQMIEYFLTEPFTIDQTHLNHWHRQFTTLENQFSMNPNLLPPNTSMDDLYYAIAGINEHVHALEGFTYWKLPRRNKFPDSKQYAVTFTNANNHSYFAGDQNHSVWNYCRKLPEGSYNAFTDPNKNEYTVWLNEDIVGKDQVKTWMDHDTLIADDVTGSLVVTPNIMFDPNQLYKRVLNDTEFQRESMKSKKTFDRPPLGIVYNSHLIKWEHVPGTELIEITLDDQLIWRKN